MRTLWWSRFESYRPDLNGTESDNPPHTHIQYAWEFAQALASHCDIETTMQLHYATVFCVSLSSTHPSAGCGRCCRWRPPPGWADGACDSGTFAARLPPTHRWWAARRWAACGTCRLPVGGERRTRTHILDGIWILATRNTPSFTFIWARGLRLTGYQLVCCDVF